MRLLKEIIEKIACGNWHDAVFERAFPKETR